MICGKDILTGEDTANRTSQQPSPIAMENSSIIGSHSKPTANMAPFNLEKDGTDSEQSSSLFYDQEIFQDEATASQVIRELVSRPQEELTSKLKNLKRQEAVLAERLQAVERMPRGFTPGAASAVQPPEIPQDSYEEMHQLNSALK